MRSNGGSMLLVGVEGQAYYRGNGGSMLLEGVCFAISISYTKTNQYNQNLPISGCPR